MKHVGSAARATLMSLSGRVYGRNRGPGGEDEIVLTHGSGSHVFDTKGREYVDCLLGSGPLILGHAHPRVTRIVGEQLARGSTFYAVTPPTVALAEEVCRAVPCAERMAYAMSGSDAISMAIRVARAHTNRRFILKFEGAYHGWHDYALSSSESAGMSSAVADEVLTAPFNDLARVHDILSRHGNDIAAVLVEPVQRYIPPAPGFLRGLRDLTRRCGAVLIFDEIVTGFRLAYGGAQEYYDVLPDLAAIGKALGGGYPIAALCGNAALLEECGGPGSNARILFGGTFNGYPIGAVAGLATLEELRGAGVYERLAALGQKARAGLAQVFADESEPCQVLGEGPMLGIAFQCESITDYQSTAKADVEKGYRFRMALLEFGIFVNVVGSKLYFSLAHSDGDLDRLVDAARRAIRQIRDDMHCHRS